MSEKIDITVKRIGNVLIDISDLQDAGMEKWSDVSVRPNNLSDTECVGFVNKEATVSRLNLVIDIQAPANTDEAILRIWAIESALDNNQNERFNNIQLDFDMNYTVARAFTQKGAAMTRDDIRAALQEPTTQLSNVVVSNQSGFDKTSQQPLGERYDVSLDELNQDEGLIDKVSDALDVVLSALKDTVAA